MSADAMSHLLAYGVLLFCTHEVIGSVYKSETTLNDSRLPDEEYFENKDPDYPTKKFGNPHYAWGISVTGDSLLKTWVVELNKPSSWANEKVDFRSCGGIITSMQVYDKNPPAKGKVTLTEGRFGQTHAQLQFKSTFRKGFHYIVAIYGIKI